MHKQKMNDNTNDLLFIQEKEDNNNIKFYRQVIPITIHHFYIISEIGDVSQYLELIQTLKTAEQHDTIFIYLNTEGGSLTTTIQILSAMKQCNATIITCLEGEVASAGTMIFLAGHKYLVNPNCSFMVHNYRGGILGRGQEIAAEAKFHELYVKRLYDDVYSEFLSQDEISSILEGKDIWMTSDQVIERLGKRAKSSTDLDVQTIVGKIPILIDKLINDEIEEPEVSEKIPKIIKSKPSSRKK